MAQKTVLVVGATGHLGSTICELLAKEGTTVKGLVRPTSAPEKVAHLKQLGVQTVEGDMKDRVSLDKAMQGVTHVVSTATAIASRQEGDAIQSVDDSGQMNVIDAAAAAGVQQMVFISFNPISHDFPLQRAKRHAEQRLQQSGMAYTILQPGVFMEVWLSPFLGFNYGEAKATIYGDGQNKIPYISQWDVARYAVASVDNERAKNKTFALGGPQALSPLDVVQVFEQVSGRKFEVAHVPQEALEGQLKAAPDDLSQSFAGLMLGYAKGFNLDTAPAQQAFGLKLKSVTEYAQEVMAQQPVVH